LAARGICVARNVYNQVKAKLALAFAPMGQHRVKNIAEPVEVWRVMLDGAARQPMPWRAPARARFALAAAALALVLTGSGLAVWKWTAAPVLTAANSSERDVLAMPTGPSIAVLPFVNLTGDPAQEYFVDGVTEDIITELSKFQAFRVIARNSTFHYKGQAIDVRHLGEALDARYVVEGSVRRSPERIRVSVQLLDATDGDHVWGETYDRALTAEDVFAIQDELTRAVATTIADEHGVLSRTISEESRRKHPEELSSYECVLRLHEYNRVLTPETHLAALTCLERTVKLDPNYPDAWAALAEIYVDSYTLGFNPVENALDKALGAAQRALAIDPRNQQAQYGLAYAHFARRELENYLVNIEKLVRLNPNNGYYLSVAGWAIAWSGQCARGRELFEKAIKLNPYHPGWLHYPFVICYYWEDEYGLALAEAHKLELPDFFWTPMMFAAIYGQMGRTKEAEQALADAVELNPDLAERPRFYIGAYVFPEEFIEKIVDGLRKAGLPERGPKA
jgi:TolB-like protein